MADNPAHAEEEKATPFPLTSDDGPLSPIEEQDSKPELRTASSSSHRKVLSSHILSKIPFMRSSSSLDKSESDDNAIAHSPEGSGRNSMATAQQAIKVRRRKSSLRKTALLGKGVLGRKGTEAKTKSPLSSPHSSTEGEGSLTITPQLPESQSTPRPSREEERLTLSISPPRWLFPTSKTSFSSLRSSLPSIDPASSRASITSPTVPTDHSTTDEDEQGLSFPKLPYASSRKAPSSSGDSYFPPQPPLRLKTDNRTKSPLATQPQSPTASVASEEEWDYSETAYWGYVILISTWLVFVVGMGSCFDVWSWAWDVGETPYAPPELNDDPTLPIVGYYPALMVLTCVMAWIWVVTAWVGMKYFRHAEGKDEDDDG